MRKRGEIIVLYYIKIAVFKKYLITFRLCCYRYDATLGGVNRANAGRIIFAFRRMNRSEGIIISIKAVR